MASGPSTPPSPPFIHDGDSDLSSTFTRLDTLLKTCSDSDVDLLRRILQKHSDRIKIKADEETPKIREISANEFENFKLRISSQITSLAASWKSAKVVQTTEKVSFFYGVMFVLFSALLFGLAPQYVHVVYTLQAVYLLPLRLYLYKKKDWHYFVFDVCYFVNIVNLLFIWFFPSNTALFTACYCLSHGSLASGIVLWGDSLVFHDHNKLTTLFVHMYPPFTFTVIRHFYPGAEHRFPALGKLPHLEPLNALFVTAGIYVTWQLLYWKFVFVNGREKIASGQRLTSFSWIHREKAFMAGQFVYSVLTELPAVFCLYDSPLCSGIFLIFIFSMSTLNGARIIFCAAFGHKFERELEALQKELAQTVRSESGPSVIDSTSTKGSKQL